jgi:hypothetical protein
MLEGVGAAPQVKMAPRANRLTLFRTSSLLVPVEVPVEIPVGVPVEAPGDRVSLEDARTRRGAESVRPRGQEEVPVATRAE